MCEKGVAQRILVHKREEVRGSWRECITRGFKICTSPSTVTVVKSRKMKWAVHVITTRQKTNACVLARDPAVVQTNTLSIWNMWGKYCHCSCGNGLGLWGYRLD
jgi:hypothetical protein